MQSKSKKKWNQSGLTAVELLVVTVIIGIVASIATAAFTGALDRAKQRSTMADIQIIARAIAAYSVDHHELPDDSGGLESVKALIVPYSKQAFPTKDHWGHEIHYDRDSQNNYTLESFGKDGFNGPDYAWDGKFDYTRDIVMYNGVFVAAPE